MNKTKIEWCDYTVNPVKGLCPMACSYCYARAMYKRFKWNPEIRYEEIFYYPGIDGKPGDKYFVGSTMELFGDWVMKEWMEDIFRWVRSYPQRTFIFLTKQPHGLKKWSPFPDNCWVGVSATDGEMAWGATAWLRNIEAGLKFMSLEPLFAPLHSKDGQFDLTRAILECLDWVIIGAQTPYSSKTAPKAAWVKEITDTAKGLNLPVFHKDNLGWIFDADGFPRRQEIPTK